MTGQSVREQAAMAAAKSLRRRPDGGGSRKGVASIVLFALFVVLLLVALVAGLRSYAGEVGASNASKEARLSVGFLANTVRGFDSEGFLAEGAGPEGEALVLLERTPAGTFETRIYRFEGSLVQEYAVSGAPYTPANAQALFPTKTFAFAVEGGLLTIDTDAGQACVALRSAHPLASQVNADGEAGSASAGTAGVGGAAAGAAGSAAAGAAAGADEVVILD